MKKDCKLISGLPESKTKRKTRRFFSVSEKHAIINDYLTSGASKKSIWNKYTGCNDYHGSISQWMRSFGYGDINKKSSKFVLNHNYMKKHLNPDSNVDSFEVLQLKKRVADLEKQLQNAELKAIAFSTMVDIAERELKIPIRKKFNTKP